MLLFPADEYEPNTCPVDNDNHDGSIPEATEVEAVEGKCAASCGAHSVFNSTIIPLPSLGPHLTPVSI